MNAITRTHKTDTDTPQGVVRRRISKKLSRALDIIATEGTPIGKVAEIVGMDRVSIWRALQKENVVAELEQRKARYITAQTAMRATLKARALEVAGELMETASSEAVRMRAVEFLAGESKAGPSVSVTVNAGGYEFVRPGQQLVEIEGTPDRASSADGVEDADIVDE